MFEFTNVEFKELLDIPNLQIAKGKITSLTGASRSGKTTILKMLKKTIYPTEGVIMSNGQDLKQLVYTCYISFKPYN